MQSGKSVPEDVSFTIQQDGLDYSYTWQEDSSPSFGFVSGVMQDGIQYWQYSGARDLEMTFEEFIDEMEIADILFDLIDQGTDGLAAEEWVRPPPTSISVVDFLHLGLEERNNWRLYRPFDDLQFVRDVGSDGEGDDDRDTKGKGPDRYGPDDCPVDPSGLGLWLGLETA